MSSATPSGGAPAASGTSRREARTLPSSGRVAVTTGRRVAMVTWATLLVALGALPLAGGYASLLAGALTTVVAALAMGFVALGLRLRVGRVVVAFAAVCLGVVALVSVTPEEPPLRVSGVTGPLAPLLDAVPRLLTAPRPAALDPDLLAPSLLLVWIVAVIVALLVVPAPTAGVSPLVGAVVLYAAGALLTAGQGDRHGVIAFTIVVVVAAGWVWLPHEALRRRGARRGLRRGGTTARTEPGSAPAAAPSARGGKLLPLVASTGAAGIALVAAVVPASGAFEPRHLVPPPQLPASVANPIPQVTAWNLDADRELFRVTPRGAPLPDRLRLVTLSDYTGAHWQLDGRFRAVGVVDEPDLPSGRRWLPVDLDLEIVGLTGPWLPSAGHVEAVQGAEALMDVDTGSLIVGDGVGPGEVALSGRIDAPTLEELAQAGVPPATAAARYLDLPRLPQELAAEAQAITEGASSRYEQALAIEIALREGRGHDPLAPSGSSYGRIQEFLFLPEDEGGQIGSSEQFAGAFAVLARSVGLPTRLVVGVDVTAADVDDDAVVVRGEHVKIWPEVYFARAGWVPFDPTSTESAQTPPEAPVEEDLGEAGSSSDPTTSPPSREPTLSSSDPGDPSQREGLVPVAVLIGGLGVAMAVVLVLLALREVRRARWRRAGAPGAWSQVMDAVVLAGRRPAPGESSEQIVADLPEAARADGSLVVARAQEAAYAPVAGDAGRSGGEDDSWPAAQRVAVTLRRGSGAWWRQLWWYLDPAVLRSRSGRR